MATSTAPAIKAALTAALEAAFAADTAVEVSYGAIALDEMRRQHVFLAGIAIDQTWAAIGARKRDEDLVLDGAVAVMTPGLTQQQATERAFELLAVVEDTLRSNVTVDGRAIQAAIKPRRLLETLEELGRGALIDFGIHVTARI